MLSCRQKEFSDFVGKVIFDSMGAVAGIEGYAAVGWMVYYLMLVVLRAVKRGVKKGVTLELTCLPIHGNV